MSPQKSQIDLDSSQKDKILASGGEFICVLSRKDIADLDFMDWATGLKNRDRYIQWYEGAKGSKYIGSAMRSLNYHVSQIDRCEEQLKKLTTYGSQDTNYEREILEEQLKTVVIVSAIRLSQPVNYYLDQIVKKLPLKSTFVAGSGRAKSECNTRRQHENQASLN